MRSGANLSAIASVFFWLGVSFSVSALTPPDAHAQAMVLPGQFNVSPQGAATISIPISVPPGTGGMVPALSINYTSGGSNGLLGVGWGINGLLAITRCPQTLAQDGYRGSVTYDVGVGSGAADNDRWCLNGERLIAINGGVYGANGTQYRTESEDFLEITSYGTTGNSPSYFEVHTKSGQTMYFGQATNSSDQTTNSQVMLANIASPRSWLVDEISDTSGNYMDIAYTPETDVSGNSEVLPSVITYTGNTTTGLKPYNEVVFKYESRPDMTPLYTGGSLSETTMLLQDIQTWNGTASPGSGTEVNDYQFTYQTSSSTGRSLLSSVKMCDGADSNCLPARTFTYQSGGSKKFSMYQTPATMPGGNNSFTSITGDFNGDGRGDWATFSGPYLAVFLSNGDGTFTKHVQSSGLGNYGAAPTPNWVLLEGDFNGDGKSDFAFLANSTLNVYLSNGDGTFTLHQQTISGNYGSPPGQYWTFMQGDFNDDGRGDFAALSGSTLNVYLSNGDGTFTRHTQTSGVGNYGTTAAPTATWELIQGDFNGDGKSDFGLFQNTTMNTYLSNGDGTFTMHQQSSGLGSYGSGPLPGWSLIQGDFNGDGNADFALISSSTSNSSGTLNAYLSKGDGTFIMKQTSGTGNFGTPPPITLQADIDGDGKGDFGIGEGTSTPLLFISNGDGTFTNMGGQSFGVLVAAQGQGDFLGDGKSGFFSYFLNNSLNAFALQSTAQPDLLTSISNGLVTDGGLSPSTSISYGTLAEGWGSYYLGWNAAPCSAAPASYPTVDVSAAYPVVTGTSSTTGTIANGAFQQYSSSYSYACERADMSGRGILGFAQQTVTDPQTGIVQTTNFLQSFPYIGEASSVTKTLGATTLDNTVNCYAALTGTASTNTATTCSGVTVPSSPALPWSGTQFPYVYQSVVTSNDIDQSTQPPTVTAMPTVTTTNTYDAYGDALTVATSKKLGSVQGSSQTTTNTYQTPNLTNWILGRLTQSQVVSVTP